MSRYMHMPKHLAVHGLGEPPYWPYNAYFLYISLAIMELWIPYCRPDDVIPNVRQAIIYHGTHNYLAVLVEIADVLDKTRNSPPCTSRHVLSRGIEPKIHGTKLQEEPWPVQLSHHSKQLPKYRKYDIQSSIVNTTPFDCNQNYNLISNHIPVKQRV